MIIKVIPSKNKINNNQLFCIFSTIEHHKNVEKSETVLIHTYSLLVCYSTILLPMKPLNKL